MKKQLKSQLNIILSALLVVLIFIIDSITPAGYIAAPLYTIPLLTFFNVHRKKLYLPATFFFIILVILTFFFKPPLERTIFIPAPVFNKAVVIIAGCIFMYFIFSRNKAVEALAKSERESRELVETAESIIIRWKPNGIVTFINEFGLNFFGYKAHELIGYDIIKIFPGINKNNRPDLEVLVNANNAEPEKHSFLQSESVKKNGELAYVAWTNKIIKDEAGNIKEILTIGNDITQLKNTEEEYRILADNSPAGISKSTKDGYLLYGNDEFLKIFEFSSLQEAKKKYTPTLFRNPEEKIIMLTALQKNGFLKNHETEIITKAGKFKTILVGSVLHNDNIFSTTIDISERKKLEASLQEKEQRASELAKTLELERNKLSAIINNLPIGIGIGDYKGETFSLNKAGRELNGLTSEEEVSSRIEQYTEKMDSFYLDGRAMPLDEWPIIRALKGEFVKNYELRLKYKLTDRERILSYSTFPIQGASGAIDLIILMIDDLTERKQAEEILKRDNETLERLVKERTEALIRVKKLSEIGTLASTIAHELRNPLAAIELGAYNIERKTTEKEKIEKHLTTIKKKILESNQIINNLLHFARVKPPELELVDVYELILDSEKIARGKYQKKEIQLFNNIPQENKLYIKCDPVQLQEVFSNVLNNAFDALGDKGKININVQETHNKIIIIIKDNGPGISPEITDKIFEPFTSTKSKGTGLGLAISRQIIENHNGTITIDSGENNGTNVTIVLPK